MTRTPTDGYVPFTFRRLPWWRRVLAKWWR